MTNIQLVGDTFELFLSEYNKIPHFIDLFIFTFFWIYWGLDNQIIANHACYHYIQHLFTTFYIIYLWEINLQVPPNLSIP